MASTTGPEVDLVVISINLCQLLFKLFRDLGFDPGVIFHLNQSEAFLWADPQYLDDEIFGQRRKVFLRKLVSEAEDVLEQLLLHLALVAVLLRRSEWRLSAQELESQDSQSPYIHTRIVASLGNDLRW